MLSRPRIWLSATGSLIVLFGTTAQAQIDPGSPTTQWVPILYRNSNYPDPSQDQQTGSTEGDIIGNLTHASLYMQYNSGPSPSPTSGWLGFRLRIGLDANPPGFTANAFIGLDANLDGALDIFVGVDNQGATDQLGIFNPGTGLNISPSTTTINPPSTTYAETAATYSLRPVTATMDPTATSFDLNGDGGTDQFLTFIIPFADLASALAARGITGFTTNSPMAMVAATATQQNSLNQDLNGVPKIYDGSQTWAQLGAETEPYTPSGSEPVPEPTALAFLAAAGAAAVLFRQKGRRRV